MSQQIQIGQKISPPSPPGDPETYIIKKKLGQGSSGQIYLVELESKDNKQQLKQQYAMKVQNLMQKNEEEIIKLLQDHPCDNLLNIKKYWNSNGKNYIIMDIAAGGNLFDFMAKKKMLQPREVQDLFYQLCKGVLQLHKLNIIHRDLKPENILLTQSVPPFNLKICDYGLSKQQTNTQTMQIGTIYYMAPELLQEKGSYDSSIDIWALGCIWYSLVAKVDLFTGSSQQEIYNSIFYAQQEHINNKIQKLNLQDWEKQLMKSMINIQSNQRLKIDIIVEKIEKNTPTQQSQNQNQINPQKQQISIQNQSNPPNKQIPQVSQIESINSTGENQQSVPQQLTEMKSEIKSLKEYIKESNYQSTLRIFNVVQQLTNLAKTGLADTKLIEKTKINSQQIIQQNFIEQESQFEQLIKQDKEKKKIQKDQQLKQQIEEMLRSDKLIQTLQNDIKLIQENMKQISLQAEELQKQIDNKIDLKQIDEKYQQQLKQIEMLPTNSQQIIQQEITQIKQQVQQLIKPDLSAQPQSHQLEPVNQTNEQQKQQLDQNLNIKANSQNKPQVQQLIKPDLSAQPQSHQLEHKVVINPIISKQTNEQQQLQIEQQQQSLKQNISEQNKQQSQSEENQKNPEELNKIIKIQQQQGQTNNQESSQSNNPQQQQQITNIQKNNDQLTSFQSNQSEKQNKVEYQNKPMIQNPQPQFNPSSNPQKIVILKPMEQQKLQLQKSDKKSQQEQQQQ